MMPKEWYKKNTELKAKIQQYSRTDEERETNLALLNMVELIDKLISELKTKTHGNSNSKKMHL
nr:hypothetical protein [uncultured Draconibacterium sp.]